MSASTEKKNRIAAREAGTDKKLLAQQEEMAKKAKSKRRWTWGTVGVIALIAAIIILNSGLMYSSTKAVTVGDTKYSPAEMNYYYANQYLNFYNTYGSYASIFGLDTSNGIAGLKDQPCTMMDDGSTWFDYFMDGALNDVKQVNALVKYAKANNISLTEEELAAVDEQIAVFDTYAEAYGYSNADNFLGAQYGTGVTTDVMRKAIIDAELAGKAAAQYADGLEYTAEELEAEYETLKESYDTYQYASYLISAEKAEGETEVSEEALKQAKGTANLVFGAYNKNKEAADYVERLNAAIAEQGLEGEATVSKSATAAGLGAMAEWLTDESREAGQVKVIENDAGDGCYVVVFLGHNDNHYPTVSVRHILIKAEAEEDGTYTDEAKAAALARIEEIKAEYEAGAKTEEAFATMANLYSEDAGSNTNGGLYENVSKGQMVEEFDAFCFEGHKAGDLGVVYGENSGYAGYHLIYFVGEGENYSDYIARSALVSEASQEWLDSMVVEPETHFWSKLIG